MRTTPIHRLLCLITVAAATLGLGVVAHADGSPTWVFFTDKGPIDETAAIAAVESTFNDRALDRRRLRRTAPGLVDVRDLPVDDHYVQATLATGVELRIASRWLNAISVSATRAQRARIDALPFVRGTQPVRRGTGIRPDADAGVAVPTGSADYGLSEEQLTQINLIALHDAGFRGAGVVIGVLDTGFNRVHEAFNHADHPLDVIAEWDFINDDGNTGIEDGDPESQHRHGTWILGTMGAYAPNELLGGAYDASFILCKTEDTSDETPIEEDYYVAGLEFIENNGGDVATSSLGYIAWYEQSDLDGATAVTTVAVNIATANGLHCCTAAGNGGHDDDPETSHLLAPADAYQVIACGAVNSYGEIAGFSSDGPTADGRLKPEVLARGVSTSTVHSTNETGYSELNGTSLSTPLVAGAVACLVQAHPDWTVDQLREAVIETADLFGETGVFDPLFVYGHGLVDAAAADAYEPAGSDPDLDGDGEVGASDLAILLAAWGDCDGCPEDLDGDGTVGASDLAMLLAAWG